MSTTPPSGEPELLELGHRPQRKPRRGLVVGIVAGLVLALGLPLGAFALLRLFGGGGTQPHDVLPANAVGYLRFDLDPSAPQKVDAIRFLRTFPAFEKYTRITDDRADVREVIVDAMLEGAPCDLTFERDVAPWLGERFGVAMTPPTANDDREPNVVAAVQVGDEQAARQGLERLRSCDPAAGDTGGWAYLDGYMILAETRQQAAGFAQAAERTPLADNEQFRSDMERLGEQGVASLWFSGEGLHQVFSSTVMGDPGPAGSEFDLLRDDLRRQIEQSYRSGAVAFRFDDRYVELATVLSGDGYREPTGDGVADMALPETTAVAVGLANAGEYVDQQWDTLLQMSGAPERFLERQLGLELPADLQSLVGERFTLALDGAGLDFGALARSGDPALLDLGARATTDPAAFTRVVQKLEATLARQGLPIDLVVQPADGGAVVALNKEYAGQLAETGSLADTDVFTTAVPDADEAQSVFFVSFDRLEGPVLDMVPPMGAEGRELTDNVTRLEALGISSSNHDGYATGSLRLTVGE
ncbi:MAG: DUF3352 domain-containing protein [Actinomycetota bacterium]|nr:DUF3352 domain-containing protein [Actinomycetota bacterium]